MSESSEKYQREDVHGIVARTPELPDSRLPTRRWIMLKVNGGGKHLADSDFLPDDFPAEYIDFVVGSMLDAYNAGLGDG